MFDGREIAGNVCVKLAGAPPAEQADYVATIGATARTLGVEAGGYRLIANHGRDSHQEVFHLHTHILAGEPLGPMLEGGHLPAGVKRRPVKGCVAQHDEPNVHAQLPFDIRPRISSWRQLI